MELSTYFSCCPTFKSVKRTLTVSEEHPHCLPLRRCFGIRNITISNLQDVTHIELVANDTIIWSRQVDNESKCTIDLFTGLNILPVFRLGLSFLALNFKYKTNKEQVLPTVHFEQIQDMLRKETRGYDLRFEFVKRPDFPLYIRTPTRNIVFSQGGVFELCDDDLHPRKERVPDFVLHLVTELAKYPVDIVEEVSEEEFKRTSQTELEYWLKKEKKKEMENEKYSVSVY